MIKNIVFDIGNVLAGLCGRSITAALDLGRKSSRNWQTPPSGVSYGMRWTEEN